MKKKILSVMLVLGLVWIGSLNLMANKEKEILQAMKLTEEVKRENSEYKEILLELRYCVSKAHKALDMWESDGAFSHRKYNIIRRYSKKTSFKEQ